MPALDLTREVPRSPFDTLEGFVWLPRLIDKTRAYHAGTLGGYTPYPCPGDRAFLKAVGLEAGPLGQLIRSGASDAEIAAFVKAKSPRTPDELARLRREMSDPATGFMRLVVWLLRWRARKALEARYQGLDMRRLDSLAKLLAAEEGHPLPGA